MINVLLAHPKIFFGTLIGVDIVAVAVTALDPTALMTAITALITAIGIAAGIIITAIGGLRKKIDDNTAITQRTGGKTDELVVVTGKVEAHVNSEATGYKLTIENQRKENETLIENHLKEIAMLHSIIAAKDKDTALLAQADALVKAQTAVARVQVEGGTAPAVPTSGEAIHSTAPVLKEIEQNTKTIEKNTAQTAHTVQELKDKP